MVDRVGDGRQRGVEERGVAEEGDRALADPGPAQAVGDADRRADGELGVEPIAHRRQAARVADEHRVLPEPRRPPPSAHPRSPRSGSRRSSSRAAGARPPRPPRGKPAPGRIPAGTARGPAGSASGTAPPRGGCGRSACRGSGTGSPGSWARALIWASRNGSFSSRTRTSRQPARKRADEVARQGEQDAQLEDAEVVPGLVAEHVEQLPVGEPGRDDAAVSLPFDPVEGGVVGPSLHEPPAARAGRGASRRRCGGRGRTARARGPGPGRAAGRGPRGCRPARPAG